MGWLRRLRRLPIQGKVAVTFVGVVAVVLAASMTLSFRYWEREFVEASRQQASLAASSARAALESTLPGGRLDAGRRSLEGLVRGAPIASARLYGPRGSVLLSSDVVEEGSRSTGVWIPHGADLPRDGILKQSVGGDTVFSYLPVDLGQDGRGVLELVLPVGSVKTAMERGALLGNGLMLLAFLALGLILVTMLEREVVVPLSRMESELARAAEDDVRAPPSDEVGRLARSMTRLLERERQAEARIAERDRELQAREGFAEVGEMAAEMAHEFKRPLASIRTAVDLLQQEYHLDGSGDRVLGEVEHQLDRLRETMGDLFSLAKPVAMEAAAVSLPEVVDDALMELRALDAAQGVRIERLYDADVPTVSGDRRRLEQAILNLLTNAAEAMPGDGTVRVEVRARDDGVAVVVSDTGPGIPPEEVERAVRPFYSTKPLGTGLGLPLVTRVIAAHGGELSIESEPGQGTRVTVFLAPAPASASSDAPPSEPHEPSTREPDAWPPSASSSSTTTT